MSTGDQSKFMSLAEQMKEDLGPALCLAKWKQVSLHLPTGLNNSCYHPPLHPITADDLSHPGGIHNTEHKKQQRVRTYCQRQAEATNVEALRVESNAHFRKRGFLDIYYL